MENVFYVVEKVDTRADDHSSGYGSVVETVRGIYLTEAEALNHPGVNQKAENFRPYSPPYDDGTTEGDGVRTITSLVIKMIEVGGVCPKNTADSNGAG